MSFFEKIRKKLFSKQSQYPSSEPMVAEQLSRTQAQRNGYLQWLQYGAGRKVQETVHDSYLKKLDSNEGGYAVHLLQMAYANGFAITYPSQISSQEFMYLFDWLKDRVLAKGNYRLINAERHLYDRGKYVETKEKYYLKPHISSEDQPPFNQYYGNILIEHIIIDRQPSYIKLVANIYSDRTYTKAIDFKLLVNEVFSIG